MRFDTKARNRIARILIIVAMSAFWMGVPRPPGVPGCRGPRPPRPPMPLHEAPAPTPAALR